MKLRLKILLLALLPLAAALCGVAWAVVHQQRELLELERSAGQDAQQRQAAAAQALALIAQLDYGTDGYFFVYDLQGRVLMHSRQPELVGRNLWEMRDPHGAPTIQRLIAQARAGGGYVEYLWRQPSSERMAPKLGYVVALPQWNWMLGTGLYLDGIQATLAQLEAEARGNVARTLRLIGGIALAARKRSPCGVLHRGLAIRTMPSSVTHEERRGWKQAGKSSGDGGWTSRHGVRCCSASTAQG